MGYGLVFLEAPIFPFFRLQQDSNDSTFSQVRKRSEKAACSLEQPAGVGPLPIPHKLPQKKQVISHHSPHAACLEKKKQFDEKLPQLVKSVKSIPIFFIPSNFCSNEINCRSAAGPIQLVSVTRFQTPLLRSCSRSLTIPGPLLDPNDEKVSQRNQHVSSVKK